MGFPEFDLSADKTSVESAERTSVMSADKTSVVSAHKTSVVSQNIPSSLPIQGRPRSGRPCVADAQGMSWETTDVLSADTTDVLSTDTQDVVSADTRIVEMPQPGFARFGTPQMEIGHHLDIREISEPKSQGVALTQ